MAGIEDYLPTGTSLPSFFFGNAPASSPVSYQGLQTRRKIVESMLAGKRPYPKTIGEGITSIGEALGERRALSQLDAEDAAQQALVDQNLQRAPAAPGTSAAPVAAPAARPPLAYADPGAPADTAPAQTADTGDTVGSPYTTVGAGDTSVPLPPPRPVYDRSKQVAEVQADPALATRLQLMAAGEVGSDPIKQQIQMETPFNRAAARDQTMAQVMKTYTGSGSGGYYPPETFLRGQASPDVLNAVMRGSNLAGNTLGFTPTGNASGGVAARGIASGRYGDARALGTGGQAETYVTQETPGQLARLAGTRVPAGLPDSGAAPVASVDPADAGDGTDAALAFSGNPAPAGDARDAITQALLSAQQSPVSPDTVTLPPDALSGSVTPGAIPFSDNPPTVAPDIVPTGAPRPIQVAAAAAANPPIPTSIQPAPSSGQPGAPLVSPADLYQPPKREPPAPPAEPPKSDRELYGERMVTEGLRTGNPNLVSLGQNMIAPLKEVRTNQYARDVTAYNNQYGNYISQLKMDEEKRYSRQADLAALAKSRFELPAGAIAGPTQWPPPAVAQMAPPTQVAGPVPPTQTALPPGYNPALGTPQSPQRSGIPQPEPPPPGIPQDKWIATQTPILAKNLEAAKTAQNQFTEALDTLQQARVHPGRALGVGALSNYAINVPGSAAAGFGQLMKEIQGKNFLQGFSALKDTGANARFTQLEAAKTEEAQARLGTAQSPADFDKALNDFEDHLRAGMELAQRRVNQPVTAYRLPGDNSSYAPDIGQVGVRAGKPQRYIGGNPHVDSSYQPVQ